MLKNVKMPTIIGFLIFIGMINTAYETFKARKISAFGFYKQSKFHANLSCP